MKTLVCKRPRLLTNSGGKSDHYHINEQRRNATRKDFEQVIANKMKLSGDGSLKNAIGKNVNPFFHVEETFAPIISPKALIVRPQMKVTFLHDLPTQAAKSIPSLQTEYDVGICMRPLLLIFFFVATD